MVILKIGYTNIYKVKDFLSSMKQVGKIFSLFSLLSEEERQKLTSLQKTEQTTEGRVRRFNETIDGKTQKMTSSAP